MSLHLDNTAMSDVAESRYSLVGDLNELRDKGGVKADLRRVLEAKAKRMGVIKAEARTREEMAEEALYGETRRRE